MNRIEDGIGQSRLAIGPKAKADENRGNKTSPGFK